MIVVITPTTPQNLTATRLSLADYRVLSEHSPERHEYRDGEVIVMPGGSEVHSAIMSNLLIYLGFLLRDTDFRLYGSDLRIWIPAFQCGTYADLMVIAGEPELNGDRNDEVLNPLLIVEVLSPSTEAYDRGEKFKKYRSLTSFCEYLLISQTEPYIEQFYNRDSAGRDRWQWQDYTTLDHVLTLHSLNVEVPLTEICCSGV
ncbi:Uma2 family endonuclease [Spirulina major]|uniref:Uma2 family endonuclease n=1 Tax=Spirulina major TaxID=270636 RepID=UPI003CCC215B